MTFDEYLQETETKEYNHLHVQMNSKSDRTHRGAGKDLAKAHGGEWHSFYSANNNTKSAVHVIKIHKDKALPAKHAMEKEHDIEHVHISNTPEPVLKG